MIIITVDSCFSEWWIFSKETGKNVKEKIMRDSHSKSKPISTVITDKNFSKMHCLKITETLRRTSGKWVFVRIIDREEGGITVADFHKIAD